MTWSNRSRTELGQRHTHDTFGRECAPDRDLRLTTMTAPGDHTDEPADPAAVVIPPADDVVGRERAEGELLHPLMMTCRADERRRRSGEWGLVHSLGTRT